MPRLPFSTKLYYGMAALSMTLPDLMVVQWLLVRYVPPDKPHLVPAALFGLLFLIGRVTEGATCSLIAHWSDVCQSRWGRRLPFMRLGILPFVMVFFLLFVPPVGEMHWTNAVYAGILIPIYFVLYTTAFTPYLALIPEITSDLKERVDLTTAQSVFMVITNVLFTMAGTVLQQWGWVVLAGAASILVVIFYLPAATRLREGTKHADAAQEPLRYLESVALALRNRPCRIAMAAISVYWFGLNAIIVIIPHWTISYLGRSEGDVTKLMIPFVAVNFVFFFVFNALATRLGKYAMMLVTFLGSGLAMMAFCLVGRLPFGGLFLQSAVIFSMLGAPLAGFMVLPYAILSDVIDHDAQLTGHRREAIFIGVTGVMQKIMLGLSALTVTIVPYLGGSGKPTAYGLKLMAFLAGLACIGAFLLFIRYPLREHQGKIRVVN